jgi:hypothetical protein
MILGTLEILAEAYTLSSKSGIPAEEVHALVKGLQFYTFYLHLILIACRHIPSTRVRTSSSTECRVLTSHPPESSDTQNACRKTISTAPPVSRSTEALRMPRKSVLLLLKTSNSVIASRHIRRLTAVHNAPMPTIDIAHQHLITARAIHANQVQAGKEAVDVLDWSGIVAGTRVAAGLDAFESKVTANKTLVLTKTDHASM